MNLTSLTTFVAIVDTGSLVRASERLNVTQSTVTARLQTLEDELGQILLYRQKSGATLTPAGSKLLHYARIMTGLWRQAKMEAGLSDGLRTMCNFGCAAGLWDGLGQQFLDAMLSFDPGFAVSIYQGDEQTLEHWLRSGLVDVVLTYDLASRNNQTVFAMPPEEIALYSTDPKTPIDADPQYIFVDHGEAYRRQHAEHYHAAGVARTSFNSSTWALSTLLEKGGSAYLPKAMAEPLIDKGLLYFQPTAPTYQRNVKLIANDVSLQSWPWFDDVVQTLSKPKAV